MFPVVKILNTPMIVVKFIIALINISQKLIDGIINRLIDRLIKFGLYEPRLTVLINELESTCQLLDLEEFYHKSFYKIV